MRCRCGAGAGAWLRRPVVLRAAGQRAGQRSSSSDWLERLAQVRRDAATLAAALGPARVGRGQQHRRCRELRLVAQRAPASQAVHARHLACRRRRRRSGPPRPRRRRAADRVRGAGGRRSRSRPSRQPERATRIGRSARCRRHQHPRALQGRAAGVGSRRARPARAAGVNQNVLPAPGSLSTPISPPISSTSRCEIARPRPGAAVAARRRAVGLRNVSNRPACAPRRMPMPVSLTSKRSDRGALVGHRVDTRVEHVTSPAGR